MTGTETDQQLDRGTHPSDHDGVQKTNNRVFFLGLRHSNQPQFEGDKTQVGVQTSVFELDLFSILFYFGIRTNRTLTKRQIQKSKSLCIKIQYMTKEKMAEGLNDAVKSISFETKSRFAILIILVFLFISWTILW